jgi:hypothetical protein
VPILSKSNLIARLLLIFSLIVFLYGCSPPEFLKGVFYPEEAFGKIYVIRVHAEPSGQPLNIYINKKLTEKVLNGYFIEFTQHTGKYILSFDWPPVGVLLPKQDIQITIKENQEYYLLINHINKNARFDAYNPDSILNVISSIDSEPDILNVKKITKKEALIIMDLLKKANIEIQKSYK